MLNTEDKDLLTEELSDWGVSVLETVLSKCEQYGVLCHPNLWSDGKKG